MGRGDIYGPERAVLRDPRSGLRIIRLTHHSTISTNLYFEMCSFSRDDQYVVLLSERVAGRDAPWDLFRARTDGMELVQMTDADDVSGIVVSPAADAVFYQSRGKLRRQGITDLEESVVAKLPGVKAVSPYSLASMDEEGMVYFGNCAKKDGNAVLFKVEVETGQVDVLHESHSQNHVEVDPTGRLLQFGDERDGEWGAFLVDTDGTRLRPAPFDRFAHNTWFGSTGKLQGTLLPPGHAIVTFGEGDKNPRVLTEGRYYWHSSASADANWIVSDTNWPQEGIFLLHVASKTVTYVCDPRSSCSHPQWTHPHPSISPGLKYILFNSDMTGIGQVYVAELTGEFLDQAARGYQCSPQFV